MATATATTRTIRHLVLAAVAAHPEMTLNEMVDAGLVPDCEGGYLASVCWSFVEKGLMVATVSSPEPGVMRVTDEGFGVLAQIEPHQQQAQYLDSLGLLPG